MVQEAAEIKKQQSQSTNFTENVTVNKEDCTELIERTKFSELVDIIKIKTERGNQNFLAFGANMISPMVEDEKISELRLPTFDMILDIMIRVAITINKVENQKF